MFVENRADFCQPFDLEQPEHLCMEQTGYKKALESLEVVELLRDYLSAAEGDFPKLACTSITSWSKFALQYTLHPPGPLSQHLHLVEDN